MCHDFETKMYGAAESERYSLQHVSAMRRYLVARPALPLEYPFVWRNGVLNGYSSTRVSLWDSLMFGRLAMGFANVRMGTRVLIYTRRCSRPSTP